MLGSQMTQEDVSSDESCYGGTPVKYPPGVTLRGRCTRHRELGSSDRGGWFSEMIQYG